MSGRQRFPDLHRVPIVQTTGNLGVELMAGRINVLLTPTTADDSKPASERKLRTLISDVEEAATRYFQDFGIYPINHVVVIRDDALARLPGLPRTLFDALCGGESECLSAPAGRHADAIGSVLLAKSIRPVQRRPAVLWDK